MEVSSSSSSSSQGWRVKLYELESSGTWIDHGIGFACIQLDPAHKAPALCVLSESKPQQYLLQSKIQSEDLYEKQGETIILWKEADFSGNIDYALSFQASDGCTFIWNAINEVQSEYVQQREYGNVPSFARTQRVAHGSEVSSSSSSLPHTSSNSNDSNNHSNSNTSSAFTVIDDGHQQSSQFSILPVDFSPQESFLLQLKLRLESLHPSQRDYVSAQLLHEDCLYFKQLIAIFSELEKQQKHSELVLLAEILRYIFLLNDPSIIEYLLSQEEVFHEVAGIFEYDKTLREKGKYRQFLFQISRQRQVIQLSEEVNIASRFLYRLKYVRDIMLHPTIDDPGITAINSMITFTSGELCAKVMSDEGYMTELFSVIYPNLFQRLLLLLPHPSSSPARTNTSQENGRRQQYELLYEQQKQRRRIRKTTSESDEEEDAGNDDDYHSNRLDGQKIKIKKRKRRRREKMMMSEREERTRSYQGVLFLRELITLSKFMSFDRRVDLFKSFFASFKDLFLPTILFIFHGSTRSLHHRYLSSSSSVTNEKKEKENSLRKAASLMTALPQPTTRRTANDNSSNNLNDDNEEEEEEDQETIKDNLTEKQEGLSQHSSEHSLTPHNNNTNNNNANTVRSYRRNNNSEDENKKNNDEEEMEIDQKDSCSDNEEGGIEWLSFEELFSEEESLEVINHLADILSTIAFTFPSLLRQTILEGRHPLLLNPSHPSNISNNNNNNNNNSRSHNINLTATNPTSTTTSTTSISTSEVLVQIPPTTTTTTNNHDSSNAKMPEEEWMERSLFFLLVDNVVNGQDITAIELFGETIKAIIDFDKQINNPALHGSSSSNNNCSNSSSSSSGNSNNSNSGSSGVQTAVIMNQLKIEKEKFLPVFYDFYLAYLLAPYCDPNHPQRAVPLDFYSKRGISFLPPPPLSPLCAAATGGEREREQGERREVVRQSSFALITSRRMILEIVTICVLTHSYRIKYFLMKGQYIHKILSKSLSFSASASVSGASSPFKSMQLSAIKLLKAILMTKDDFYSRHLEQLDCFRPVIALLQSLQSKEGLLASSIYDLVEYIRNEGLALLIHYLMKKYGSVFEELVLFPAVDCFEKLKTKYLQMKEHEDNPALFSLVAPVSTSSSSSSSSHPIARNESLLNNGTTTTAAEGTAGRKRLSSLISQPRAMKMRKMTELDREERYFDEEEEDEEVNEVEEEEEVVVPFEEDPFFFPRPQREPSSGPSPSLSLSLPPNPNPSPSHTNNSNNNSNSNGRKRAGSPRSPLSPSSPISPVSPHFLETLKYKTTFPSRPPSPPHYSQRKHGSPIDGESPAPQSPSSSLSSSLRLAQTQTQPLSASSPSPSLAISAPPPPSLVLPTANNAQRQGSGGGSSDIFSLLSIYDDQDLLSTKDNNNNNSSDDKEGQEEEEDRLGGGAEVEEDRDSEEANPPNSSGGEEEEEEEEAGREGPPLPLPPLRAKFESEDDEEVIAAVFSSSSLAPVPVPVPVKKRGQISFHLQTKNPSSSSSSQQ